MRKLPTFSLRPSRRQVVYLSSAASLCVLASFFSVAVIDFFLAFSASKCSSIGRKSHLSKTVILVPSSCERCEKRGEKHTITIDVQVGSS